MSLYPSDGGNGGGSGSVYPDTVPGINSWSDFPAISNPTFAGFNLIGANNVSAVTLTTTSDISGAGNVYVGGYIQATGKIESPNLQIPNNETPATITTLETNGSGEFIITTDGGGLTVLNGSAPATINAGELALSGNGTITGVDSLTLTGTASISGVQSINGQAFSGIVTNPLQANLDAGTHDITNLGSLAPTTIVMPTNSVFTPTFNTGQIYFDGSLFQFSAPISVPLPGAGFGPVNIVQNKAQNGSGGNLPSYYRYLSGRQNYFGQLTQPNPVGFYGDNNSQLAYWTASFGNNMGFQAGGPMALPLAGNTPYPPAVVQSLIFNYSIIQVTISCTNMIVGSGNTPSECDYIMVGGGSVGTINTAPYGAPINFPSSNQLNIIRKAVPAGGAGTLCISPFDITFTLIKGLHYSNSDVTLDFFVSPSGTQQFGNIYGVSPPGFPFNWQIVGLI
jgi:hypothetical protein